MIKNLYLSKNFYLRSSIYAALSLLGAAMSYAIYPALIRILPREVFGDIATSLALASQLTTIFLAFNIVSLYVSKKYQNSKEQLEHLQKEIVKIFVLFSIVIFIMSPALKQVLHFGSYTTFWSLMALMLLSIPAVIWIGYLQGKEEMARVGIYIACAALFKFLITISLAIIFRSDIAIVGIVLGQLIGIIVLAKLPGEQTPSLLTLFESSKRKIYDATLNKYLIIVVVSCILLSFAQNADILFGKALLDSTFSGTFVAVSSLSNVVFYTSSLIIWISLSGLSLKNSSKDSRLLLRSSLVVILIGILVGLFFSIAESYIFTHLIPDASQEYVVQLYRDTLYQSIVVLATLILYWKLATKSSGGLMGSIGFAFPIMLVPLLYDGSGVIALINTLLVCALAGFGIMSLIILFYSQFKKRATNDAV